MRFLSPVKWNAPTAMDLTNAERQRRYIARRTREEGQRICRRGRSAQSSDPAARSRARPDARPDNRPAASARSGEGKARRLAQRPPRFIANTIRPILAVIANAISLLTIALETAPSIRLLLLTTTVRPRRLEAGQRTITFGLMLRPDPIQRRPDPIEGTRRIGRRVLHDLDSMALRGI
jgi:hypothetical protein